MAGNGILSRSNYLIFRLSLLLLLFLATSALKAQSPADFSGVWNQDNVKSDDFYKEFNVKCTIIQNTQTFTVRTTFFEKSGKELTSVESVFNLDGKEVSKEEQGGINKESAVWSADRKTLTTRSTRTVGSDVYGSTAAYTLSDDGNVLTVQTADISPIGTKVKQVFNKGK